VRITDVTLKRYSAAGEARSYAGGLHIVEVQTDGGVAAQVSE
jgi:hypothetical protein